MVIYGKFFLAVAQFASVHLSSSTPDNRRHFILGSRTVHVIPHQTVSALPLPPSSWPTHRARPLTMMTITTTTKTTSFLLRAGKSPSSLLNHQHRCHHGRFSITHKSCCFKEVNNVQPSSCIPTCQTIGFFFSYFFLIFSFYSTEPSLSCILRCVKDLIIATRFLSLDPLLLLHYLYVNNRLHAYNRLLIMIHPLVVFSRFLLFFHLLKIMKITHVGVRP